MDEKAKQDLRDSADFLQEDWSNLIDFLSRRGHAAPQERAEEIVESLNMIPNTIFAAKTRIAVLLARLEQQNFKNDDCFLTEHAAYLELKDILDLI